MNVNVGVTVTLAELFPGFASVGLLAVRVAVFVNGRTVTTSAVIVCVDGQRADIGRSL